MDPFEPIPDEQLESGAEILTEFESVFREAMPLGLPEFDVRPALWAAVSFYRAGQFLMFRDIDEDTIQSQFRSLKSPNDSASSHYSIHMIFRFLPDLVRSTKSMSANDPLNSQLMQWGADWPISSVGISGLGPLNLNTVLQNPSLRRLYIDRIIKKKDTTRITDDCIRNQICIALGESDPWAQELLSLKIGAPA